MMRSPAALVLVVCVWGWSSASASGDDARFEAARVHLQKGRYEEAREVYGELAEAKADPARVAVGLSLADEAEGDWKEATEVLEQAVRETPRSADLWARLAELQFRQGRYEQAEQSVEQALKRDGQHLLARLVQAELFTETGRIKEADAAYRWFVRHYNQAQPEDAASLLLVGRGAVQYARWNSVSSIFNFLVNTLGPDALKDDEHSWQAHHLAGALFLEKYNRAEGIPELRKALAINPRAVDVIVELGNAALDQHDLDEADKLADQALKVNPRHVAALQLKADVRLNAGKVAAARPFLDQALEVNPHEQRTLARLAACHLLEDGLPPDNHLDRLLSNLDALDEIEIDKPDRFSAVVHDLAKRNPRPGYFLTVLGETLDGRKRFDAAERIYLHAAAVMPQLAEPKTGLGMLYMRTGRTDEAERLLDEAFKADPYHVRVSNMRKVLKLLDGYETISTDHFVICFDSEADRILGRYMAEYLEEIYPDLVKRFGYEPPQRTQFEIYNKGRGLSAHQWFSARMVGLPWIQTIGASTGMMVALASPNAVDQPFNWAKVLRHEFVHVITLQQTNFNIPHWFTEALAVSVEGYPRPAEWNRLLLERVPRGELRSLDELNDAFIRPASPTEWQFAYCQSRLYAEYMAEQYGEETIEKMLAAYRDGLTTEQAIPRAFGVDARTFERGYREFLNKLVAELRGGIEPEPEKAPAELEKAHQADPDDPKAAGEYAWSLLQAGRRTQARELAEKALEQDDKQPRAALVMAVLELRAENVRAAIGRLEPALDRDRPDLQVLKLLAQLKLREQKHADAAELFELGREKFPFEIDLLKGLAAVSLRLEEPEKLKAVLVELSQLDSDDALVRKKLAELALDERDYTEAARYARLSLHINVLDPDTHRILADALTGLNEHDRAVREYQTALDLKPDDTDLQLALAKSHLAAGDKPAALRLLDAILKRTPDQSEAKRLREELR